MTKKKTIKMEVAPVFEPILWDWFREKYLLIGGYGSGKSYHAALKLIIKLLEEKRKAMVIREVYDTIYDSCYVLLLEILDKMDLLTTDPMVYKKHPRKVLATKSPLRIKFKNGSEIIFKGMDKPEKVKSIHGVSIVWFEECSEIKYSGYKEVLGRIRTPGVSMHFILSCNPVSRENWVYRHFFCALDDNGVEHRIIDEQELYDKKQLICNGTYYHHSTASDNKWLPYAYIERLNELRTYDIYLYNVARWGMFGTQGIRVLPQVSIATSRDRMKEKVYNLGIKNMYFGFDFGFEESFNAVISMSVDPVNKILYIWDEIYTNHITDDKFAVNDKMVKLKDRLNSYRALGYNKMLVADSSDPKAIAYYRSMGYPIRACRNRFVGSRLSNTRKIKRFKKILISPKCINTIRELSPLTYKTKPNGDKIWDEFNIDPHTFKAIA